MSRLDAGQGILGRTSGQARRVEYNPEALGRLYHTPGAVGWSAYGVLSITAGRKNWPEIGNLEKGTSS